MTKAVILSTALAFAAAAGALPPACAKMLGKKPAASADPVASVDVPPPPISSATAPPIWHAPEEQQGTVTGAGGSDAGAASGPVAPGPDLAKARAAAEAKEWKKVRALLDKRVLHGKAAPEESQLVLKACKELKDKACVADVKAKHPEDVAGM